MKSEQDRVAVLHGPESLLARLRERLSEDLALRAVGGPDEAIEALSSDGVSVILMDHCFLMDLPKDVVHQARSPSGRRVPLIAIECPDGRAAGQALRAGAVLAARADATPDELQSLVTACMNGEELARDRTSAQEDLRRQRALVMKDDLTAAYNRRFFERFLDEEIDRARRFKKDVSLIFMDVDDLREVNKKHGHAAGSQVLQEAAARTIRTIRSIDKVVRYGGDEFCILLPETATQGAREVAERVRAALAQEPFAVKLTGGVSLTASFGIASYPDHATSKAELVKAADAAMLQIKESRKDGIRAFGEDGS